MIDRFDEALLALLRRELPFGPNEVTVSFEQPSREHARDWLRPTINLYLHDLRENNRLRGQHPVWNIQKEGNQATIRRQPLNFDLHYMITAWAIDAAQEHRLLMEVLMALLRNDGLPVDLRQQFLPEAEEGVSFKTAQYDMHINPRDIWSVLDNEMRPAIDLVATVTINPFHRDTSPLVREIETNFHDLNRRRA